MMAPHYAAAWAWAGNCPFQWGKQVASHLGGTRNPMVVRWPDADHRPGRRCARQFTHVHRHRPDDPRGRRASRRRRSIDGIEQKPMHGTSFALHASPTPTRPSATPSSTSRSSATARCTRTAGGCRAMLPRIPWDARPGDAEAVRARRLGPGRATRSSCTTCPTTSPRRTTSPPSTRRRSPSCRQLFWEEAEKYHVMPLLGGLDVLLRHRAAARRADHVHLLRRRAERRAGHDPARSTTTPTRSAPTSRSRRAAPRA